MLISFPVYATDTATVAGTSRVNFTPWRAPILPGRKETDPHPDTSFPQTVSGTQADTQFGRNLPQGFSQVGLLDVTVSSGVGDFQNVINRINSTPSGTSRVNQLQTEINQNQSQAGYIFNNKFSITSMTDSSGNLIGQANGNFIQTRQDLVAGAVQTTTCVGTFTTEPVLDLVTGKQMFDSAGRALMNYTNTSGTNTGQGPGCTTK
ncbi:MAG: hypothetical protein HYR79_03245 [Nitrospirae bacterium]|nr:hypothetical protein [Nitrospirota bacterium]